MEELLATIPSEVMKAIAEMMGAYMVERDKPQDLKGTAACINKEGTFYRRSAYRIFGKHSQEKVLT